LYWQKLELMGLGNTPQIKSKYIKWHVFGYIYGIHLESHRIGVYVNHLGAAATQAGAFETVTTALCNFCQCSPANCISVNTCGCRYKSPARHSYTPLRKHTQEFFFRTICPRSFEPWFTLTFHSLWLQLCVCALLSFQSSVQSDGRAVNWSTYLCRLFPPNRELISCHLAKELFFK